MNRAPDMLTPVARRRWLGWVILGGVAAAIGVSFLIRGGDEGPAQTKKGARATPVTVVEVRRETITHRGRYPGELDADTADVAAFYSGRVLAVKVRVGDAVAHGHVVAELDPIDAREQIAQAKAQAKAAAAERNRAGVDRDQAIAEAKRLEPLARDQLISMQEVERQRARAGSLAAAVDAAAAGELEANARVKVLEKRIVESVVRAPFAGRVAARYVDPGAIVAAGARLVRIVAASPLRIRFEVPESDVGQLAAGTMLTALTQASEGSKATAKVTGMSSEVSRERRVAIAEAVIESPPPGWLPGMYAEAVVDLRTLEGATVVPARAVLSRLAKDGKVSNGVFVASGDVAEWVQVREVTRDGDRVAIEGAVAPGARVLVGGHVDLEAGGRITIAGDAEPR